MTRHDLSGLGNAEGKFGRQLRTLSCGRVAYEAFGKRRDVMVLSHEKRIAVYRWLKDGAPMPAWWPGWP